MANGALIVITGPAAVGKSTVTKALQAQLSRTGDLWLAIEVDVFARALSREWVAWGKHRGRYGEHGFVYARAADGGIALELGPDGRRVLAAFHRSVAAVVRSGVNVICEAIVYDEADWNDWSNALGDIPTRWVRLRAPLAVLEEREKSERSGPAVGLARGMVARRPVGQYDLEPDTATESTVAIVERIVDSLAP